MVESFYPTHLQRVSRSFAFCIAELEGQLKEWVSLSYLMCRILDTVEDAPWSSAAEQSTAYGRFEEFLHAPAAAPAYPAWAESFPEKIPEGERLLLVDAEECFRRFHALPVPVRDSMKSTVLNMYRGMCLFTKERKQGRELRLRSLIEVNQYCFYVAGVVGELLTHLLAHASIAPNSEERMLCARHFGLFLQKVNLLKDQRDDEREGRFLVAPSRRELLASAAANAEGALRYIQAIPLEEKGYRLFCAWSLFLGLGSLRWMERFTFFGKTWLNKPPRVATHMILGQVRERISQNEALAELFRRHRPDFPPVASALPEVDPASSPMRVYEGIISRSDLATLGLR
jgi:phytoene/squalene synthetase